jgi:hypothetical protein
MKKPEATDILALHAVSTLPDSLEARRKILCALVAACPRSRYAESISVLLEYLEQHQACLERSMFHSMSKSQTQNPNHYV